MNKILKWISYLIMLSFISMYFYYCDYLYYKEYRTIKKELKKVNGIEILEFEVGNPDVTAEEMYTTIRINDEVETLFFLDLNDFTGKGYGLTLENFGTWEFKSFYCSEGKAIYMDWLDGWVFIGASSNFSKKVNLRMNTVQELADRYEDVEKLVELIPEYPEIGMFNTAHGGRDKAVKYFFRYRKNSKNPKVLLMNCDSLSKNAINWN